MPAGLSLAELRAAVDARNARIQDLSVACRFDVVHERAAVANFRSHKTVVVKGGQVFVDYTFSADPRRQAAAVGHIRSAFDGRDCCVYNVDTGRASVSTRRDLRATVEGEFFDVMMLNPAEAVDPAQARGPSLAEVLAMAGASVRPSLEVVDGRACYVVDVRPPLTLQSLEATWRAPRVTESLWLDAERDYLPILHRTYQGDGRLLLEFRIEDARRIPPGFWCAVRGRKTVGLGSTPAEYEMVVDGLAEGRPAISINAGVTEEAFALAKHLPAGTLLVDQDDGSWTTVGAGDAVDASLGHMAPREPRDSIPAGAMPPSRTERPGTRWGWIAGGVVVLLTGAMILLTRRRRQREMR